ncbi:hypothetical protein DL95DRAFT_460726 [Leptodontidium sp. 2 PMI_412]|nr:hypothetical protein DL95DRAFT_460726 [Leptodontidium sp. 2 PMI_412]
MADPVETHAELILSTAKLGEEISVNLLKFSAKYSSNQVVMPDLSIAVGLISGNLENLSETIEKFGPKIDLEDALTKPLVVGIRAIFEKMQKALEEGIKAEDEHGDDYEDLERVNGVPQPRFNARRNVHNHAGTLAFTRTLGGYPKAEALVWYLETQKGHLFFLAKAIRYLALKKMEDEDNLEAEQKAALQKLIRDLPQLLKELQWRKPELEELAIKWKAGEDLTETQRRRNSEDVYIIPRQREIDVDARSISSMNSVVSDVFVDAKELYETWLIRKVDGYVRRAQRHWSFLGLKFHEIFDNDNYNADPMPCSQEELKNKYELSKTGEGSGIFRKKINNLPAGVYRKIEFLLQERIRNSRAPKLIRTWKFVDATPASPLLPKQQTGWFGWFKGEPEVLDWTVVLKVESSSLEGMEWPNGSGDPFRKTQLDNFMNRRRAPTYNGRREISPEREIVIDQRRNTRYTRRVEPRVPTPGEAHDRIKDIIAGIGVFAKDSGEENPFAPVAGVVF